MLRAHRSVLPLVVAVLAVLVVLPAVAGPADAATSKWIAKCDDVRIRTEPRTSSRVLRSINEGAVVTAVRKVRGGRWSATCGTNLSSRTWLKIVAINGRSTRALFGRGAVYAAAGLFKAKPAPTPPPPTSTPPPPTSTTTDYVSNCSVRLRSSASTVADTTAIIDDNTLVTGTTTVQGSTWAADCGLSVSGDTWYRITAVGGQSVSSLYGVSAVFAASGLFRAVTATSGYLEGIDVSKWQGIVDWAQVRAAGKRFAIGKATEGVGYKDESYDRNKAGARAQGLVFGAYHFARPGNNDPVREADWFLDTAGYERGMIVPTLDLEQTGGLGPNALTTWTKAWVQRVDARLGVKPMIYTSPSFWRNNLNDTRWFADNGYAIVWIAHWGVSSPSVPAGNWGGRSWTFWQYTSDGRVPGISGRVDLNRYRYQSFEAVTY
jgi:GH25 family lysozyme M1 (1,4-beta-N-acetylmuramidase)